MHSRKAADKARRVSPGKYEKVNFAETMIAGGKLAVPIFHLCGRLVGNTATTGNSFYSFSNLIDCGQTTQCI